MTRVLHVYKTYGADGWGGVERCIAQLLRAGAARGDTGEVLTTGFHDSTEQLDGVTVHTVRRQVNIASTPMSWRFLSQLQTLATRFDVIHYHFPWPWMDLAHLLGRVSTPSVVTYHSDVVRQTGWMTLYRPLMHRFLASVNRIIVTSPNYLATSPILARYQDKCTVIPIGLDPASYPPPTNSKLEHWRARVGEGFFLFVGVLRYYKGLHLLVEAARRSGLPIVIAGDGPMATTLHAQSRDITNIHWLGNVSEDDKAALLSLCKAFVFPSHLRAEAFGISLLEAAMHGKAMISTEIGTGTSYINQHHETGIVVPPENPQALADAMQTLSNDAQLSSAYGQAAQQRFTQLFQAEQGADQHAALYHDLLQANHHAAPAY
jgi:rhamnosyl/mannosyltransferase